MFNKVKRNAELVPNITFNILKVGSFLNILTLTNWLTSTGWCLSENRCMLEQQKKTTNNSFSLYLFSLIGIVSFFSNSQWVDLTHICIKVTSLLAILIEIIPPCPLHLWSINWTTIFKISYCTAKNQENLRLIVKIRTFLAANI